MQQKVQKNVFVFKIIKYELVSLNWPYTEQDTFHW